ncbi:MAG: DUF2656 family protein [Cyanobacteria bacterium J06626_18]
MDDSVATQHAERTWGRMLLSHNFNLSSDSAPVLSRDDFAQVFVNGFEATEHLKGRRLDHPHWIVEVMFDAESMMPSEVGKRCAEVLAQRRSPTASSFEILALGGLKTTPATSASPDALQPGHWGVDMVETPDGDTFLQALNWEAMISQRSDDQTFKVTVSL